MEGDSDLAKACMNTMKQKKLLQPTKNCLIGCCVALLVYKKTHCKKLLIVSMSIGIPHPSIALEAYSNCVYLDYNATTPIWPEVSEKMKPFTLTSFGNPSSSHVFAAPCRSAVSSSFAKCIVKSY
jgi:hypothetical protein